MNKKHQVRSIKTHWNILVFAESTEILGFQYVYLKSNKELT